MTKQEFEAEIEQTNKLVDRLAEAYATDSNGVFNLPDYIAFKAGVQAGMAAQLQIMLNKQLVE